MKFAFISPNYYPLTCGVGDHSMRLVDELRRRGHEATVFTHAPAGPNPEAPEVSVVGIPEQSPLRIANSVVQAVSAGGFSHVVIQYAARMWGASRFGSTALPLLAAALSRRGLFVTLLSHELFTPWSWRPDLAVGAASLRLQFAATMRSCRTIFVTTESRRQMIAGLAQELGLQAALRVLRVGPNALPTPARPIPGRRRLGVFSTLAYGKSFDAVIDAFDRIQRRYANAELMLIGDLKPSASAAGQALLDHISRIPGNRQVHLTGKLTLSEVAKAIAEIDVYLFPMDTGANTRSGTLPVALGSGVPAVAIRGPETDSIFVHGDNVFFANGLDGSSFAKAALAILEDKGLSDRLSVGGRRLYEEQLSWERITDSFLEGLRR